jgi:tetratricopeptide (TPR) repeat protein
MDRHLEEFLRSVIGSDPNDDLDDKKREAVINAALGMLSAEKLRAVWDFAASISDEAIRSHVLHKLVPRLSLGFNFKLAKQVADSIPLPYWRFSAVTSIASDLLTRDRGTSGTNSGFREEAIQLIREVDQNLHLVPEQDGDRASIVWSAGLTLVDAGELDWAEKLAECSTYCSENTGVLLRVAKARSSRGDRDRARQIIRKVADLASSGEEYLTNRAIDLKDAGELAAELGEKAQARRHLDDAIALALKSQEVHDIDGAKIVGIVALSLAKLGEIDAGIEAASKITQPARREQALQRIWETFPSARPQPS